MSIKYYRLAKDEEPPDEFCAVRDIGGEPSEYTFYVPEAENAKLRELVNEPHECYFKWSLADNGWADHTCSKCGFVENTDIHVRLDWNYCPNCGRKVVSK